MSVKTGDQNIKTCTVAPSNLPRLMPRQAIKTINEIWGNVIGWFDWCLAMQAIKTNKPIQVLFLL